jgi:cellulose synthase/poly-beta-1,6-N-acetylglucosamine synthase-like glycosyltransferase
MTDDGRPVYLLFVLHCIQQAFSVLSSIMLTSAWYILVAVLFGTYATIHFLIFRGLRRLSYPTNSELLAVSIIVAARNEEESIGRCLHALVKQNYPKDLYEIIVVNDRSTDATAEIVMSMRKKFPFIKLIGIERVSADLPPKKFALDEGIRNAKHDVLVFTDADSYPPQQWLREVVKAFTPHVGVVAGYSPFEWKATDSFEHRWGDRFLRYEELKNTIGAAAAIGMNNAYMCTGRNFAYRRAVFNEVGGFDKIKRSLSGDDDLFIQVVQRTTSWQIRYMTTVDSVVVTEPPVTLEEFVNQRKRHFSAAKYYPMKMKAIFAFVHAFNALALFSLILFPLLGIVLCTIKLVIDWFIMHHGTGLFGNRELVPQLIQLELMFVLYNLIIGPLGYLGSFEWKGTNS